jgi:hypothetical protein
MNSLTRT